MVMDSSVPWLYQIINSIQSLSRIYFILLIVSTLLLLKIIQVHISVHFSPLRKIPSPPRWPVLHHLPYFFLTSNVEEMYHYWIKKYGKNGRIRTYTMLGAERFVTSNQQDIKTVLVTKSHKFSKVVNLKKLLPELRKGLFIAEGKFHAWLRKLLIPAFRYSTVQNFSPVMAKYAQRLVQDWATIIQETGQKSYEIVVEKDLSRLTFDVTCETIFGCHTNSTVDTSYKELTKALQTFIENKFRITYMVLNSTAPIICKLPFGMFRKCREAQEIIKNSVEQIIDQKRSHSKQCPNNTSRDLLDIMMELKDEESNESLTNDILRHNVLTFMIAGLETTSTALTWILYLLATHPEKQELAREEARAVLSTKGTCTAEDATKLNYITAVVKESLRLSGPVFMLQRTAKEDVTLDDVFIPKGCSVYMIISLIHLSEESWENAKDFWPERHLHEGDDDELKAKNSMSYLPFSTGPNSCIGKRLAMLNMKIVLAFLIRAFKFTLPLNHPKVGKKLVLTLKPSPSVRLEVTCLEH